jgi:hypothetical protein
VGLYLLLAHSQCATQDSTLALMIRAHLLTVLWECICFSGSELPGWNSEPEAWGQFPEVTNCFSVGITGLSLLAWKPQRKSLDPVLCSTTSDSRRPSQTCLESSCPQ